MSLQHSRLKINLKELVTDGPGMRTHKVASDALKEKVRVKFPFLQTHISGGLLICE